MMEFKRATAKDVPAILQLQAANLVANLDAADRQDGFLSAEFTRRQLEEMATDIAIVVASEQGSVLGFLCAARCEYCTQFPLVAAMIRTFSEVQFQGRPLSAYRSFIYGPVCIARAQRGRGLLVGLYQALLNTVEGKYEVGVALIAKENPRSLRAHVRKLAMTPVGEFDFAGRWFDILAFSVTRS